MTWRALTKRFFIGVSFLYAFCLAISGQDANRSTGRLAYVHNQAVWIKALPVGEPVQVLPTPATHLTWSPSGTWLALRAPDKTIVISDDGQQQFRINTDDFAWSPLKDELAFTAVDGLHVDRFDSGGSHPRVILRQTDVGHFAWSHDGTRLAVTVLVHGSAQLWLANEDGAPAHEIEVDKFKQPRKIPMVGRNPTESPLLDLGEATFAGWSGDDKWIWLWPNAAHSESIASDGLGLIAVPHSGGVVRPLSDLLKTIVKNSDVLLYKDYVSFARADSGVVVTVGGNRESWTNKRVVYVNPANRQFSVFTDAWMAAAAVDWSPDAKHIVYSIGPDAGTIGGGEPAKNALAQRRLWMVDLDGKHQRALTFDPSYRDEEPLWSHNGRTILFTRMDRQDNISVWTIDVASGRLQKVVDAIADPVHKDLWFSFYGHIAWPDYLAWSR